MSQEGLTNNWRTNMKVKCIKIYNEHTKEHQATSPWLTIGKEYIVLAIEVYSNKTLYLIIGDNSNKSPTLHHAEQFEIVSTKMPKNWKISLATLPLFVIGPEDWCKTGFWEDCYDGDPRALEIYKREARIIFEEEGE
jgi:hypothetical protein